MQRQKQTTYLNFVLVFEINKSKVSEVFVFKTELDLFSINANLLDGGR